MPAMATRLICGCTLDQHWQLVPCMAAHLQLLLGQASCLGLMRHIGLLGPPLLDHLCLGRCHLCFLLSLGICPSCAIGLQQGAQQSLVECKDVNKAPDSSVTIQAGGFGDAAGNGAVCCTLSEAANVCGSAGKVQLPTCKPLKLRVVYLRLSLSLALSVCHLLVPVSRLALAGLSCRPLSFGILQRAQQADLDQ